MSVSAVPDNTIQDCADENTQRILSNRTFRCSTKRKYAQAELSTDVEQLHSIEIVLPGLNCSNQAVIPKYLVPRSSLPLAYLDPAADGEAASGSRLLAAHIDPLEKEGDGSQSSQPLVLLAQRESCGRFYAIEKVRTGLYAFCRLGRWVAEDALEDLAKRAFANNSCPSRIARGEKPNNSPEEWWRTAVAPVRDLSHVSTLDPDAVARARRFRLSLKRPSRKHSFSAPITVTATPPTREKIVPGQAEVNDDVQNSEDSLKVIKRQYHDTLYLSRAPLAYFAKGPLSRARASFQYNESSGNDCSRLIQFLRTMILDLQLMDKKYRETIPALIKNFPFSSLSEGEGSFIIEELQKQSRRSKKEKISKDGLYAGEDVSIARWWLGRDISDIPRDSEDAHQESMKASVLNLRRREAQLQIILLLETLALEENVGASVKQLTGVDNGYEQDSINPRAKKPKKPQNLRTLLDLLADRLCIWQSMSVETEKPAANRRLQETYDKRADHPNNNDLRQFCVDVVVPFYGSRLSEATTLLCQKLGGPKDPSPKRYTARPLEAKPRASMKPGAPITCPQPRKHRQTLERVLTDEKSSHRRTMPSLSRSATEPLVQVKREVSDLTLSSIPLNRVAISKRFTQREVDLRASSQASESKHKKKIAIEQELQGAIAAIKRPNPKMAGAAFVEAAEKRLAEVQSRKTSKVVHKSFAQDFQVKATPSKNKNAGPYNLSTLPQPQQACLPSGISKIPLSSASQVIPSSTGKLRETGSLEKNYQDRDNRNRLTFIDQTPSKAPARSIDRSFLSTGEQLVCKYSQPQAQARPSWTSRVQETPSRPSDRHSPTLPKAGTYAQVTPCKTAVAQKSLLDASSPFSQVKEPDLYASLGWNLEVDE